LFPNAVSSNATLPNYCLTLSRFRTTEAQSTSTFTERKAYLSPASMSRKFGIKYRWSRRRAKLLRATGL
ncbi:hypothetical protein COCVIDRAFT_111264, partial [Bipolaris victoriae FI3]